VKREDVPRLLLVLAPLVIFVLLLLLDAWLRNR